jgi:predicted phosphate transport protein (TIGR00153 family)
MPTLFKQTKELTVQIDDFLDAVSEGILVFRKGVADYLSGDLERFQQDYDAISALESRADDLRRAVEGHLYRYSLIPESRGDVLALLESMDDVIDTAKNTLSLFLVERPEMIPELTKEWRGLADTATNTAEAVVLAARAFFRDPHSVNDHLHKVYFHEKQGDKIAMDLKRKIFDTDVDLARKIHLRYFTLNIDMVSDAAEDVADRLSIYAIKRTV